MEVIPVIDLKGKQAVRAQMGERHLYGPLSTPLAATSAPRDVIEGFLSLHPFRTVYAADLDAIEGQGSHESVIAELQTLFPDLTFWIDAGVKTISEAQTWLRRTRAHLVIGSESWQDAQSLAHLQNEPRIILSLDFRGALFQGPRALLEDDHLWPRRLIVMTLARVGSEAGPDFVQFESVMKKAGDRAVYAAGGLRGKDDLRLLHEHGAAGVLVASALHDGRLSGKDLPQDPDRDRSIV